MADTYKILGQAAIAASVESTIYTVPAGTSVSVSAMQILNTGTSVGAYTLCFITAADVAESAVSKNYQKAIYNMSIKVGEAHEIKGGITLSAGDQVRVISSSSGIVASIYGVEIA